MQSYFIAMKVRIDVTISVNKKLIHDNASGTRVAPNIAKGQGICSINEHVMSKVRRRSSAQRVGIFNEFDFGGFR